MKRQVTSILLFSALVLGGASTFVSCKDTESDAAYENLAGTNKNIAQLIAQQAKDVEELTRKLEAIKSCSCTDEKTKQLIEAQIKTNQNIINELKRQLTNNITNDADVQNAILNLTKGSIEEGQLNETIKKLILGKYQDLNTAILNSQAYKDVLDKIAGNNKELSDSVAKIWGTLYDNKETGTVGITSKVDQLVKDMTYTKALAISDSIRIDTLSARLYTEITNATNEVSKKIPTDAHINDLIGTKLVDYYTQTQIDKKITDIQSQIDKLKNSVDDILDKQVSEIIIQASESPITGYENTPFGLKVGFLGAYYGKVEEGIQFAGQRVAGTLISDAADNAGIIYVTVNPANVAPSAIHLRLVDSQGHAAPYKLEWANTDKVLKAGVSRAVTTSNNGFYAVKVYLAKDSINKAKVFTQEDAADLKDAGKNILEKLKHPKSTNLQLGNIASTLNSTFNNRLTMYAVEASWSQRGTDGKLVNKKVTSKYELAAAPLTPLSFEFLKDGINADLPTIPTLEQKGLRLERFNTIKVDEMDNMHVNTTATISGIPTSVTINGTIVPTAQIVEKYPTRVQPNGTVDLSGLTVKVGNVDLGKNVTVTLNKGNLENVGVTMDVPMDDFNAIIKDLNSQIGNMVGNVNNYIDKVNKFEETIDGQLINRINAYINKFENLLTKANSLLQPAMFYTTNSGSWGQLARVEEGASYLKLNGGQASTVFVASSYSAELLAPAYLKEISVDGGATLTAAGQSGSKVVLKSGQYKVGFNATKAGVYTIKYSAVDYFGKPVTKKFFVKVVD